MFACRVLRAGHRSNSCRPPSSATAAAAAVAATNCRCRSGPLVQAAASAAAPSSTSPAPSAGAGAPPPWRAYIDFKGIRDALDVHIANCANRNASGADPVLVARLYDEFVALQQETNAAQARRNDVAKQMKTAGKTLSAEERSALIARGQELKDAVAELEGKLAAASETLQVEGRKIPNLTHPDTPVGDEEDSANLLREVNARPEMDFEPRTHVQLGEELGILDFESGGSVAGAKFYYLKGAAAMLELALVNWAMSKVIARGYSPTITPDLVRGQILERCGFQPRAPEGSKVPTQTYAVENSDLCLTGTAEIPLAGQFLDSVLLRDQLPIRAAAFGRCFRTEAGSAGAATRGLYRVHQFSKVEMVCIATPEQSEALHQELVDIEIEMYTELGLHFRVLDMPTGDLGAPAYRKTDIEAWMPGLKRYGEISSASNCTDYQARRLNIRFKADEKARTKDSKFAHTLNATAVAVPRMIVAIMETFQQEDGSIVVPEVLRPWMYGIDVIQAS